MEITLTWRELLIAVVLATVVYLLEYALFASRRRRQQIVADPALTGELDKLRDEMSSLRQRLEQLETRLDAPESPEAEAAQSVYDYAAQYAREGMTPQDIAGRCGISVSEATLIVAMHQEGR